MTLPSRHLAQTVGLALLLVFLSIPAESEARPQPGGASPSSPSSLSLASATTSTSQDPWAPPPATPTTAISAGTITTTSIAPPTTTSTTLAPASSTASSTTSSTTPPTTSTTQDPFAPPPPPPSTTTSTGGAITTTSTIPFVPTTTTSTTLAPATSTTTSPSTTSTLAPTTTTNPTQGNLSLSLDKGWNLLSSTIPFAVSAETIGQGVISVWAWQEVGDEGNKVWAVYLTNNDTATYAPSKGFLVLKDIQAGEGFWLNSQAENATMTINGPLATPALAPKPGWNLLGLGEPSSAALTNLESVISVWAWRANGKGGKTWAVYLPEGKGPAYAESKGFLPLDLTTISVGEGFWLNQ